MLGGEERLECGAPPNEKEGGKDDHEQDAALA